MKPTSGEPAKFTSPPERCLHPSKRGVEAIDFREHVLAKYALAHGAARRIVGDYESASDIVQRVVERVLRRRNKSKTNVIHPAYLICACQNEARSVLRSRKRELNFLVRLSGDPFCVAARSENSEDEWEVERHWLRALIRRLPTRCRQVLVLSVYQELTNAEVAGRLGIAVRAVEKQLQRGRQHLHRMSCQTKF